MRKLTKLAILTLITLIFAAGNTPANASDPGKEVGSSPDAQGMRAAYDKINAIKMKRYDELTGEITALKDRIEGLLEKEQKLFGEKEKARSDLAEYTQTAATAEENVQKALGNASDEDEKIKSFAAEVSNESAARKEKIEALKTLVKETGDKMKEMQGSKAKAEEENVARDKEYKDASDRLSAFQRKGFVAKKVQSGDEEELARLKKNVDELEIKAREGEQLKQQLSEGILAAAEKIRASEDDISALEREDAARAKELREKIEAFGKTGSGDEQRVRAIAEVKKIAEDADAKVLGAKATLKKITEETEQVSGEKLQAEKDLIEKTEELKVRVSALIVQNGRDQELLPKSADAGEKDIKKRLKRAEKDVVSIRRKAERAVLENKELKEKFKKEMLDKHFNLAVVYEMNGLYRDSEKEYLECLKIAPDDADVHYNLAILYDDRLSDNKRAEKYYYKFLSYRPIGESGERVKDWIMLAELEKRLGKRVR